MELLCVVLFSLIKVPIEVIKNAKPGHMELDPKYGHIFDTNFFQNYNGSRIAGGGWEAEPYSRPYQVPIEVIKNAKPGHMELDPKYGHIFDTNFFQNYNGSRIAGGGWEAEPYSRPYQVGMYVPTLTGTSFCGGSLIGPQTVLTAAHCVSSSNGNPIIIYLGAHNMPPSESENALVASGTQYLLHPDWNSQTVQNDIALVYLSNVVQETERIRYVQISSDITNNYLGREVLASGWGLPGDGHSSASPVLREVTSRIISNVACRMAYMGTVQRTHICMSGEERRSTCRGDSGGPMVIDGVQIGVVSFGSSAGCEVGWPPAFTRVTSYFEWINDNLEPPFIRKNKTFLAD